MGNTNQFSTNESHYIKKLNYILNHLHLFWDFQSLRLTNIVIPISVGHNSFVEFHPNIVDGNQCGSR